MSKIIMEGFKTNKTQLSIDAILTKNLFWYDKVNNLLKVGNRVLNYYIDTSSGTDVKILTLSTPNEEPNLNIKPVEFTALG